MPDELLAFLLMIGGLGCIVAWGVCQAVAVVRAYRIRRDEDAIKLHVVRGGRIPEGAPMALAQHHFQIRWLGILGNIMLVSGITVMALAHLLIF